MADHIDHATCGTSAINTSATPPGLRAALRGVGAFSCVRGDAGVAWSIHFAGEVGTRAEAITRLTVLTASMLRADAAYDPPALSWQLQGMDNDARRTDGTVTTAALMFRAPERMEGKFTRIEGTAQNVRESGGNTVLTVVSDLLGHERIDVTYPGIASDRIVNDARVVAYGHCIGHHVDHSVLGDQVVPEVIAAYVGTRAEVVASEAVPPRAPSWRQSGQPQSGQPDAPAGHHGRRHHRHESSDGEPAPEAPTHPGGSFGGRRWGH